jgi:hypothetical protein
VQITRQIVFVGRLSYEKGVDALIDAFVLAQKHGELRGYELAIIGDGPLMGKLKGTINKAYGQRIRFEGFLNSVSVIEQLKCSAIAVLPSVCYENAPMSIVEAIYCENLLAVTNHGGMKEFASMFPTIKTFEYSRNKVVFASNILKTLVDIDYHYDELSKYKAESKQRLSVLCDPLMYCTELNRVYNGFA